MGSGGGGPLLQTFLSTESQHHHPTPVHRAPQTAVEVAPERECNFRLRGSSQDAGFIRKIPWRSQWKPTGSYSPQSCTELDTAEATEQTQMRGVSPISGLGFFFLFLKAVKRDESDPESDPYTWISGPACRSQTRTRHLAQEHACPGQAATWPHLRPHALAEVNQLTLWKTHLKTRCDVTKCTYFYYDWGKRNHRLITKLLYP